MAGTEKGAKMWRDCESPCSWMLSGHFGGTQQDACSSWKA